MRAPAFTHLAGIEENAQALAQNIFDRRRHVLEAAPGMVFVTSDCPRQTESVDLEKRRLEPGYGFRHPNSAVILPLSPTKLFYAGPQNMVWKSPTLSATDTLAFNHIAVQFAHKAVYASQLRKQIQSLVDQESNQGAYGSSSLRQNCVHSKESLPKDSSHPLIPVSITEKDARPSRGDGFALCSEGLDLRRVARGCGDSFVPCEHRSL